MNTTENVHYREAAEYATTVEAARKAAGIVTPDDCLAYELRQYAAAYSQQIYSRENRDEKGPELLSEEHPDYPQRLADRKEEGERQLSKIYALHGQELADEWAAARSDTLDERLLLACLLKESAHRLLDGYAHYLTQVGTGRILPGSAFFYSIRSLRPHETFASRSTIIKQRHKDSSVGYGASYSTGRYAELDTVLIAAGAGAAELAHFHRLLAAFHEREQALEVTLILPTRRNHDKLSVAELALLCVYSGHYITDANAKEYLEGELKSGRALYNRFTHYSSQSNRTGFADETAQVRKNMIARIQKVLPRLNDEQKKRAENDIHTLTAQN